MTAADLPGAIERLRADVESYEFQRYAAPHLVTPSLTHTALTDLRTILEALDAKPADAPSDGFSPGARFRVRRDRAYDARVHAGDTGVIVAISPETGDAQVRMDACRVDHEVMCEDYCWNMRPQDVDILPEVSG